MKRLLIIFAAVVAITCNAQQWTGTWATATEAPGKGDMPKTSLANRTLRQIIHVSLGGKTLRLKLSNEFSHQAVDIKAVYIADASGAWHIDTKSAKYLKFAGKKNITIEAGKTVISDALNYELKPLQRLAVTISYGDNVPNTATCHRGSRTTSYIIEGEGKPKADFTAAETLEHWYNISSLDVLTDERPRCVVALGNSITDGRGTTNDAQNRWTDFLAENAEGKMGVLNLGIGGTCMTMAPWQNCGRVRFDHDVLGQTGVTDLIVFYGVNDIGGAKGQYEVVADSLIHTYQTFIRKAHNNGMRIYLATITAFGKSFYASHFHEATRQVVNDWIRSCKDADGIIDFDAATRNPAHPDCCLPQYQSDWLHLNPAGYELLGKIAWNKIK